MVKLNYLVIYPDPRIWHERSHEILSKNFTKIIYAKTEAWAIFQLMKRCPKAEKLSGIKTSSCFDQFYGR